jgi:EAL domain-containing protein (putative c-di-GMP-specific phosphodiesterase class I)
VNFSPVQFAESGTVAEIESTLRTFWPCNRGLGLSFEITEGTMMQKSDTVSALLARLQDLHIGLDIYDFGTGYSSLSQLQHLPVQTLKIDRAFVSRIGVDADSLEIVRTIVALAHNLGMDIIAEGVETVQQLAALKSLGCEYAQGYYFGKPTDRETAWSLIAPRAAELPAAAVVVGNSPHL